MKRSPISRSRRCSYCRKGIRGDVSFTSEFRSFCSFQCLMDWLNTDRGKNHVRKMERKEVRKRKQELKPLLKLTDEAAVLIQRLVRLEAADEHGMVECVTCGVRRRWNDRMQGGHFISRGYLVHKLNKKQIAPQCNSCNGPNNGNPAAFAVYMTDRYGAEYVEELNRTKHDEFELTRQDVLRIKRETKAAIKAQMERLGI